MITNDNVKMKALRILFLIMFIISINTAKATYKIAILDVVDKENVFDYGTRMAIRNKFASVITQNTSYEGYSRSAMDSVLAEHDFQRTGLVSSEQIKTLGAMDGVQYVLIVEVSKVNANNLYMTSSIINVETAEYEKIINAYVKNDIQSLLNKCQPVAHELLGFRSTNVLSALRSVGLRLYSEGKYKQSHPFLKYVAEKDGDKSVYSCLANCYMNGLGVMSNKSEAAYWYSKSANLGNESSILKLGEIYASEKLWKESYRYYLMAAQRGNSEGQYKIGEYYTHGKGVARDRGQARYWLDMAVRNGHYRAKELLSKLDELFK